MHETNKEAKKKDLIYDLLPRDLINKVRSIYGDEALRITAGWTDDVHERYREAVDEPLLLDSYAMQKAFPVRGQVGRRRLTGPVLSETDSFKSCLEHYAHGLLLAAEVSELFELTKGRIGREPLAMLGYKQVHHEGALEFGLTLTEEKPFSELVVSAAVKLLQARYEGLLARGWNPKDAGVDLNDYLNVKASYPRGKNTGLPWMASGSDRLINDMVLAIDAGLACALVRGYPVEDMFDGLLLGYFVFSRFQRTGKEVPLMLDGQELLAKGIEARRRIINSTPKILALAVKPFVKFITVVQIQTPEFEQDRERLRERIAKSASVRATDASRFDLRSGGVKLRQGLDVMWRAYQPYFPEMPQSVYDLMMMEAFLPTAVTLTDNKGERTAHWTDKSALRSGASTTSRVGSVINLMYDMSVYEAAYPEWSADDMVKFYLKKNPSTIQGDDMLKTFEMVEESDRYFSNLSSLERVGMTVEEEHPTKFLGYLVRDPREISDPNDVSSKADGLYHSANPLLNMFFPERFRTYAVASMLSRYVILTLVETQAVNDTLAKIATDGEVAMMWYRRFYRDLYPILKRHYDTHPVGAARAYFATLPDPDSVSELRLARMIAHDEDELLRHIAQTTRFDINSSLFGEESLDDFADDDDVVTASLWGLRSEYSASDIMGGGGRSKLRRLIERDARVIPLTALFSYEDDAAFVRAWRTALDATSRRIQTPFGAFYVTNL